MGAASLREDQDERGAPPIGTISGSAATPFPSLSSDQAAKLLEVHGPNELEREVGRPPWRLLAGQFTSPLVGILIAACVVSALLGEWVESGAIGIILLLNAL